MKKKILGIVAVVLVLCVAIGGTLAYLMDQTEAVINTFTFGNVNITLTETGTEDVTGGQGKTFKMIPGQSIEKDPVVTVEAGSEASWVFVEVIASDNLGDYITYEIADGWTELDGVTGPNGGAVYYRTQAAIADNGEAVEFEVLAGNTVSVSTEVTKEMIDALNASQEFPTLTFYAYAVQQAEQLEDVADAWAVIDPPAQQG